MKKIMIVAVCFLTARSFSQEALHLQNGVLISVQNGVEINLQGGVTLEKGSSLVNNGMIRVQNNPVANISDWIDNSSSGALSGTGLVVFNSINTQNFSGPTIFYRVSIISGGLNLNSNLIVTNLLNLFNGKINTGNFYVFLNNTGSSALLNDLSNAGYIHSWINGNFRRLIAANNSTYDFPVGNSSRSNLLQFINNNISGVNYLTASFGSKPGTDVGLHVTEQSASYSSVNAGGVWYLVPDALPSSGNYSLQLYFNGFSGLADNQFGILRRPDASSNAADWIIPTGSLLEPFNGVGRKLSDGFARRTNISSFSQWGIGMMPTVTCDLCTPVCTYTQGFYSNPKSKGCSYDNTGSSVTISAGQMMLNAFGVNSNQIFGNSSDKQLFTLFQSDIGNGNIFKMLPGSGSSLPIAVDNVAPFTGANYADKTTWYLVPIQATGSQQGKIKNLLLSQLMTLWFNLRTSNSLGNVDLTNDTLVTVAQTFCGSGIQTGSPSKFGLPRSVISYLNSGAGYDHNVIGLFQLANDVLGGANNAVTAPDAQSAVATVNEAFNGCRILVTTIPFAGSQLLLTKLQDKFILNESGRHFVVSTFPNPFSKEFNLLMTSPASGIASIEFYAVDGARIYSGSKFIEANSKTIIPFRNLQLPHSFFYKILLGSYSASGMIVSAN